MLNQPVVVLVLEYINLLFDLKVLYQILIMGEVNYTFRVIIVGDTQCGKSSFCKTYQEEIPQIESSSTIGVDFITKKLRINNVPMKLHLWDTAGQEAFKSIICSYFRDICGAIVLFDLTRYTTFKNVPKWIKDIRANNTCSHQHPILLIGNKKDSKKRGVPYQEAKEFAEDNGLIYRETSNYEVSDVKKAVDEFLEKIFLEFENEECRGLRCNEKPRKSIINLMKEDNKVYKCC
jgi:small GTP-binding protein